MNAPAASARIPVLEAVPNISEGRDAGLVRDLVAAVESHDVEMLDWSMDADHNRAVLTYLGPPPAVEAASLDLARLALERIDLRRHRGIHPRVGALDVLPFVPLHDLSMDEAVDSARRVGAALAATGLPVFYYGRASRPPGRGLAELRRGGFEAMAAGWPDGRVPDETAGRTAAHPTGGATCVGARPVLLAWNVFLRGVDLAGARAIAAVVRERGGGFSGVRALGLHLAGQDRVQVSMNLEDPERTSPLDVFDRIAEEARRVGGSAEETEVIGMMPDTLVLRDSADRLMLPDPGPARVLSRRLAAHVAARRGGPSETPDLTV